MHPTPRRCSAFSVGAWIQKQLQPKLAPPKQRQRKSTPTHLHLTITPPPLPFNCHDTAIRPPINRTLHHLGGFFHPFMQPSR